MTSRFLTALISSLTLLLAPLPAGAAVLDLGTYQDASGAITTFMGGDTVEPYFAHKALITAHEGGMDIAKPAKRYIDWALGMQHEDGRFSRYCKTLDGSWYACDKADSDDATLALWLQLLYSQAPKSGLPAHWKDSVAKASNQLDALYDSEMGLYTISKDLPVGLLMDNLEIYRAYVVMSEAYKRFGKETLSARYGSMADELAENIDAAYWNEDTQTLSITTQARHENTFYPDRVAEIFFPLSGLDHPSGSKPAETFTNWLANHKTAWLEGEHDHYPWGLIAVAAIMADDADTAFCWQSKAAPYRYGARWNVLEEASNQHVQTRLIENPPTVTVACSGVNKEAVS